MSKTIIDTSFDLFLLSKYRTQLMGVAAMMIILCHAPQYGVEVSGAPRKLLVFLNIGVDIFLFLSGMGCYFSLMKSNGYFPWLKRRFIRITIPYTIVLFMLRFIDLCFDNVSWLEWLLYFSTIRFWTHHDGMWYVALLVLLYPLTPLIYRAFELSEKRAITAFTFILLILIFTHIPVNKTSDLTSSIIINLQGAFKRVVSFILGLYLAPYIKQGFLINTIYVIGVSALGCIFFISLQKMCFILGYMYYPFLSSFA